jgi:hypothetical protein
MLRARSRPLVSFRQDGAVAAHVDVYTMLGVC